jgi:hypothetical protein
VRADAYDRVRGRGAKPGGDAHRDDAEDRGLAPVVSEEPGGSDHEGEIEGDDGVLTGTINRDAATTSGSKREERCRTVTSGTDNRDSLSPLFIGFGFCPGTGLCGE